MGSFGEKPKKTEAAVKMFFVQQIVDKSLNLFINVDF